MGNASSQLSRFRKDRRSQGSDNTKRDRAGSRAPSQLSGSLRLHDPIASPIRNGLFDPTNEDAIHKNRMANDLISFVIRRTVCSPLKIPKKILLMYVGPSPWPKNVALLFPKAQVIALDASYNPEEWDHTLPPNLTIQPLDLFGPLPYEDTEFDSVISRSLQRFTTSERWHELLAESVRITRVGGWIELIDSDYGQRNGGPAGDEINVLLARFFDRHGIDRTLVQRAEKYFAEAGCSNISLHPFTVPVGTWGGVIGTLNLNLIRTFIKLLLHTSQAEGDIQECVDVDAYYNAWEAEVNRYEASIPYYIVYGQVTNPPRR